MEHTLLKAKAWHIFIILSISYFISWFVKDGELKDMMKLLGFCIFCIWLGVLGNTLNQLEEGGQERSASRFVFDIFFVIAAFALSKILANPDFDISPNSFHANGLWSIPMIYSLVAYIQIHWFPASILVANEQGHKPDFSQILGTFILLFFWPAGIWLMQPRLNRIYNAV
ncbi:hypothetical protein [Hymenobacter coccineus]|uniref:hypothetical protein n=1 Tax=Hymenobacter coccineus TaxID=1908235 RepID=UPI000F766BBE|nr:hypothetical protein [Hymenobacter coccineus]